MATTSSKGFIMSVEEYFDELDNFKDFAIEVKNKPEIEHDAIRLAARLKSLLANLPPEIIAEASYRLNLFESLLTKNLQAARRVRVRKPYLALKTILESCTKDHEYEQKAAFHTGSAYASISDLDRSLTQEWLNIEGTDQAEPQQAKMLSARCAEKLVKKFYEELGSNVRDVSILPVLGSGSKLDDWKFYDLDVDGKKKVDVKNARSACNNKRRYSNFCVPKFKTHREQDVTIAGVFSPYLTLYEIQNVGDNNRDFPKTFVLGEANRRLLDSLERHFEAPNCIAIEIVEYQTLPPWAFEYPNTFYQYRNANRARLRDLGSEISTFWNDLIEEGINPVPALLAARVQNLEDFIGPTSEWERKFLHDLRWAEEVTMPYLFLALITNFLSTACQASTNKGYRPSKYRRFLFSSVDNSDLPFGIYDPLNLIDDLITTLDQLWDSRHQIDFATYKWFQFGGLGILTGTSHDNRHNTLLAYCGGHLDGRGKCGHSPLIFGQTPTCKRCGKLICAKCGFCKRGCRPPSELSPVS